MWARRTRQRSHGSGKASEPAALLWRQRTLLRAGVEPALARSLAADPEIDLHAFIGLLERGCPARLAVRILAPLEWGEGVAGR